MFLTAVPSTFRADNGKYLTRVIVFEFAYIIANADEPGEESVLTPKVIDGKLFLQASNGNYACVINFTGRIGVLDEKPDTRRCPIEAVNNNDGSVSIKYLYKNKYMCRVNTQKDQSSIRANKNDIDETCKFYVKDL